MENTVTLSLEKYNELIETEKKFYELKNVNTVYSSRNYINGYSIYKTNKDADIEIINKLKETENLLSEKSKEINSLRNNIKVFTDNLLKLKSFFGIKQKTIEKQIKEFYEKQNN